MGCNSCKEHRTNIKKSIKEGSIKQVALTITSATVTLGENIGRKLIKTASSLKNKK